MVTFNNIRGKTLERILLYIIDWDHLESTCGRDIQSSLPFAWVCREWRDILLPRLFSEAYIQIHYTTSATDTPYIDSMIRLIVENGYSYYVQKLIIELNSAYADDSNIIDILNELHFDKAKWPWVYHLYFAASAPSTNDTREYTVNIDICNTISEYFHVHLPKLTQIYSYVRGGNYNVCPLSHLINLKLNRLSHLRISQSPATFIHKSFSSSLTDLVLPVGQRMASVPKVYAPTLRTLQLHDIPPDFSWRCFISDNNELYEFLKLESISLSFLSNAVATPTIEPPDHGDTQLPAAGRRRIYAPRLKKLSLYNIPLSYTQLFAPLLLLHLNSLYILSRFEVLKRMNLRIPYSNEAVLYFTDDIITDIQAFNEFTEDLFSSYSIATRVTFETKTYLPLSIKTAGWQNVTFLEINAFVSRASLYRLVSQLPILEYLSVGFVTTEDEPYLADIQHIVTTHNPDNTTISNSLQRFDYLPSTDHLPLVPNLDLLYEFVLNVSSLKQVMVPKYYLQEVKNHFGQDDMNQIPHMRNIEFYNNVIHLSIAPIDIRANLY